MDGFLNFIAAARVALRSFWCRQTGKARIWIAFAVGVLVAILMVRCAHAGVPTIGIPAGLNAAPLASPGTWLG